MGAGESAHHIQKIPHIPASQYHADTIHTQTHICPHTGMHKHHTAPTKPHKPIQENSSKDVQVPKKMEVPPC